MRDAHQDRPEKLLDLTRWNRAGVSRFKYTDGDAAVWLEELRIAMLGHYMRGADAGMRLPEVWRDVFLRDEADWPDVAAALNHLTWRRLAPDLPPVQDTRGRRNARLLEQYEAQSDDYTWEIMRAFARASHVLLGTLDAYANEGYLRTATQWDNLRRLASMVNYQPTPPASATSTVALLLKSEAEAVTLAPGLAMKYTPPEGGAPLIFETHEKIEAHPDLNAARAEGWNINTKPLRFARAKHKRPLGVSAGMAQKEGPQLVPRAIEWICPKTDPLAPGALVVVADGAQGHASVIRSIAPGHAPDIAAVILTDVPEGRYLHHSTRLWSQPQDVRVALPETTSGRSILKTDASAYVAGDLVQVRFGTETEYFEVLEARGDELILAADLGTVTDVRIRPLVAYAKTAAGFIAGDHIPTMYFKMRNGVQPTPASLDTPPAHEKTHRFVPDGGVTEDRGYVLDRGVASVKATVKPAKPEVLPDPKNALGAKTVSFAGKPPKGLSEGDWFAVRDLSKGSLCAVQVAAMRVGADEYHLVLSKALSGAPERLEFHGPMRQALSSLHYDQNPERALAGGQVTLQDIAPEASRLVKPGRKLILSRALGAKRESVLVTVAEVIARRASKLVLVIDPIDAARDWAKGETTLHLNVAEISHGETKGAKRLGSGDGERARQSFAFAIKNVSHIPSAVSETGVVPAIDVAVDDTLWSYRDFIDPSAEATRAWSTTLQDDGTLIIHFRRRLVTGQSNIRVLRHRVGAGLQGANVPAFSFDKPMTKDRFVDAIFQPFPTTGGADREALSKLRAAAPARLSANGRAVSLKDFEGLATRHAAILQAHAEEVPTPGPTRMVALTLAPVGGGAITQSMENDLRAAILGKAMPGTALQFRAYETLPLTLGVSLRTDLTINDKIEIKAAAEEQIYQSFSLEKRTFGQTIFVSEVLAALEIVPGIENALVTRFDLGAAYDLFKPKPPASPLPWPRNVATRDDAVAAIYATDHQITFIPAGDPARLSVTVEDIR